MVHGAGNRGCRKLILVSAICVCTVLTASARNEVVGIGRLKTLRCFQAPVPTEQLF